MSFRRAYNFGQSALPPAYSRSLYSPLNDMSNYSEKCGDEYVKKDGKYWERRRKNNLAAKKSRDSRRIRENQMRLRVMCLENANQMLKEEMERKDVEISNLKYKPSSNQHFFKSFFPRLQLNKYDNCQQMFPNWQRQISVLICKLKTPRLTNCPLCSSRCNICNWYFNILSIYYTHK